MRPSSTSVSTSPQSRVNLYCIQCESQIGIFENEWIRLTSSYARSKEKGTHFGTDVGVRTQTVPSGVAQKAAEGCELSDVFCKKCSNTVGQFCRTAPDQERQHLVDKYFYKLSRVFLKDSQTMQAVDPTFAFGEDIQPQAARSSAGPSQRWSQTSLPKHSFSRPQSSARQTAQPQEGHDELKSGEPNRPRSRRSAVNRESDQYDAPPEEHMSRSGHEPSFQPQYLQRQTQMRYSMPPEVYPTGMMQDHLFTPHQVYAPPVQYVQPYMSPYIQPSFARAGTVPPQPTYFQPVYAQSPYPEPPLQSQSQPPFQVQPQLEAKPQQPPPVQESAVGVIEKVSVEKSIGEDDASLEMSTRRDDKIKALEIKIRSMSDKYDDLSRIVRKLDVSVERLLSCSGLQQVSSSSVADSMQSFENTVRTVRAQLAGHSKQEEMDELRAENESLKLRLETIASAINPVHSSAPTSTNFRAREGKVASPSLLGKRKRDENEDRRSSLLQHEISASDVGSSVAESPDYQIQSSKCRVAPDIRSLNIAVAATKPMPTPTSLSRGNSARPCFADSDKESVIGESEEDRSQLEDSLFLPVAMGKVMKESPIIGTLESPTTEADDNEELRDGQDSILLENRPQDAPTDQPRAAKASSLVCLDDDSNLVNGIDFSDDEPDREREARFRRQERPAAQAETLKVILPPPDANPSEPELQQQRPGTSGSMGSRQTESSFEDNLSLLESTLDERSVHKARESGRRVTESALEHQVKSMVPEPRPPKRRRTTIREPKLIDLESAYVATPDMMALKIKNRGRPRVPKSKVQTTEKIPNNELKSLGVAVWIGKDKSNQAYKQAVDAARNHDRQAKRIQNPAEKELNVVSAPQPGPGSTAQGGITINGGDRPVLEKSNTNLQRPAQHSTRNTPQEQSSGVIPRKMNLSSTPASEGSTRQTRQQQRAEQIRHRDRMAQEAMEREEMEVEN